MDLDKIPTIAKASTNQKQDSENGVRLLAATHGISEVKVNHNDFRRISTQVKTNEVSSMIINELKL